MFSSIKFLCLLLLVAAPVFSHPLTKRDVVDPPVLAPNASTVWYVGTTQTVVWNTTGLPPYNRITNQVGKVILGHLGGGGLNLMLKNPLAQGFNITQGSVNIIVPNVPPRTDYLIVLMGDSGNTSPTFTITSGSSGTTPISTSSSTAQTSSSSTSAPTSISTSTSSSTSASTSTSTSTAAATTTTGTGGGDQSTSNPTSPSALSTTTVAPASSTSTPSVSNTITSTSSSTIVVVQTTQPATTSTQSNGALSTHRISASCLSVALIISGLLI
ncbi:hypothetical protein APHAL10511_002303 [Amanita phalloides]|nr:hypothetical protein APHAL10511_002303 [Amanita phalloides]